MHEKERFKQDETLGPLYRTEDSVRGSIDILLHSNQATKDQIYEQLCTQNVELVLTAHPTEVSYTLTVVGNIHCFFFVITLVSFFQSNIFWLLLATF